MAERRHAGHGYLVAWIRSGGVVLKLAFGRCPAAQTMTERDRGTAHFHVCGKAVAGQQAKGFVCVLPRGQENRPPRQRAQPGYRREQGIQNPLQVALHVQGLRRQFQQGADDVLFHRGAGNYRCSIAQPAFGALAFAHLMPERARQLRQLALGLGMRLSGGLLGTPPHDESGQDIRHHAGEAYLAPLLLPTLRRTYVEHAQQFLPVPDRDLIVPLGLRLGMPRTLRLEQSIEVDDLPRPGLLPPAATGRLRFVPRLLLLVRRLLHRHQAQLPLSAVGEMKAACRPRRKRRGGEHEFQRLAQQFVEGFLAQAKLQDRSDAFQLAFGQLSVYWRRRQPTRHVPLLPTGSFPHLPLQTHPCRLLPTDSAKLRKPEEGRVSERNGEVKAGYKDGTPGTTGSSFAGNDTGLLSRPGQTRRNRA